MNFDLLKKNSASKNFSDGQVIILEGDKQGNEMYVILEGNVNIYKNFQSPNEKLIVSLGAGNFFGEMTLFLNRPRSATAIAKGDVQLLAVERSAAYQIFETHPEVSFALMKTLCERIYKATKILGVVHTPSELIIGTASELLFDPEKIKSEPPTPAPAPVLISDTPPAPILISDTPPEGFKGFETMNPSLPAGLFPEGHKIYDIPTKPHPTEGIYRKNFKCPVCEKTFAGYSIRTTRLKLERRDKDFRSHYAAIDTTYYEIITCTECYYSMFENAYAKPIIARFKENIPQISMYKNLLNINITEDRGINSVFAGYYLALKGAPLFYKDFEMFVAKIWLRLMWLYQDVGDKSMEEVAAKKAHESYLAAFENTDASPDVLQQLCVLVGELSLIVKDVPGAKVFFAKARNFRGGNKTMLTQAEEGINRIRAIESGQLPL